MPVVGEALLGEPQVLAHKPELLRAFNQLHAAIWADGALAAELKHLTYQPRTEQSARGGRNGSTDFGRDD